MKRHVVAVALGTLTLIGGATLWPGARAVAAERKAVAGTAPTMSATDLRNGMRKLWSDHVMYTRNFIISSLAGLPDQPAVTERLLRNQDDIGGAFKPIYGEDAGKKLSALLRDHILIAADVVRAAKSHETTVLDSDQKKWRRNADEIAALLSSANPVWKKQALTDMLYKHLDLTTYEVMSRVKMDWRADVQAYDSGYEHMLMFADVLSDGIIKQNPKRIIQISQR